MKKEVSSRVLEKSESGERYQASHEFPPKATKISRGGGRERQRLARALVTQVPDGRVGARETLRRGEGLPATDPTKSDSRVMCLVDAGAVLRGGAQLADGGAAGDQP